MNLPLPNKGRDIGSPRKLNNDLTKGKNFTSLNLLRQEREREGWRGARKEESEVREVESLQYIWLEAFDGIS